MLKSLKDNVIASFRKLALHNIKSSESNFIEKIRRNLLSSDVSIHFVNELVDELKKQSRIIKFSDVNEHLEHLIKIAQNKIVSVMGSKFPGIKLSKQGLITVLVCGAQGSGKTSFCGKLAFKMKNTYGPDAILVSSTDNQRPAAQMQLQHLCMTTGVEFYHAFENCKKPVEAASAAYQHAKKSKKSLLIIDTAGYTHTKADKNALVQMKRALEPQEILLIMDSMTGQEIGNISKSFDQLLDITGICITKTDSNHGVGAAISSRYAISKPIKYLATGETIEHLREFNPHRITNQILDIGDIETLIEGVDKITTPNTEIELSRKIKQGKFDCEDLLLQLCNIKRMGGMNRIANFLPGASDVCKKSLNINANVSQQIAAILSMTSAERKNPHIINVSRKMRIAKGAGVGIQVITSVLDRLETMKLFLSNATGHDAQKGLCFSINNTGKNIPPRKSKRRHKK
jgi:signal recognition particle subunit SRP54